VPIDENQLLLGSNPSNASFESTLSHHSVESAQIGEQSTHVPPVLLAFIVLADLLRAHAQSPVPLQERNEILDKNDGFRNSAPQTNE